MHLAERERPRVPLVRVDQTGGDLHQRSQVDHPTIVVTVDRIEETVAVAVEHGGEQLGEIQPLGESGRWVYLRDSEGNTIGLFDNAGAA